MTKEYLPASYDERWAKQAQDFSEKEAVTSSLYMSTRGGLFRLGDEVLGNEICVIVAAAVRENTLYADKFDPDVKNPPLCYAFGYVESEMAPHPEMDTYPDVFVPQSRDCASCELNKFGSAEKGRGKACQNKRRLGLIPAGMFHPPRQRGAPAELEIYDDAKHYRDADLVTLKLPVTSVKNWAKYVNKLSATVGRPPYGVFTRVFLVPDQKDQYHVEFEMLELVPDELFDVVNARHEAAEPELIVPYKPWEDNAATAQVDRTGAPQTRSRPTLRR
jgi:hypothetical protein